MSSYKATKLSSHSINLLKAKKSNYTPKVHCCITLFSLASSFSHLRPLVSSSSRHSKLRKTERVEHLEAVHLRREHHYSTVRAAKHHSITSTVVWTSNSVVCNIHTVTERSTHAVDCSRNLQIYFVHFFEFFRSCDIFQLRC